MPSFRSRITDKATELWSSSDAGQSDNGRPELRERRFELLRNNSRKTDKAEGDNNGGESIKRMINCVD